MLAEHVLGHARVIERHVMIRPVVDHELHDRARRSIIARISGGDVLLDLRTIAPDDDVTVVAALAAAVLNNRGVT